MSTNVAILTNFMEFNPGNSLTGIVIDQAHMLCREGHRVAIFVNEQFNPKYNEDSGLKRILDLFPRQLFLRKKTKFINLIDYQTENDLSKEHNEQGEEAGEVFAKEFIRENIHVVYTHDFIFTGWNLPYSRALRACQAKLNREKHSTVFYHWVHSVPSAYRDWWNISNYGNNHLIVFPNRTAIMQVAENFQTTPAHIRIIPHIKDIRTWYDFSFESMDLIDHHPSIIESEFVQVYPCSTDRLSAKQLDVVIRIFAEFKKMGHSVCLVAANQWATGLQPMENVARFASIAFNHGLEYGTDFLFTSEYLSNPNRAKQIYECRRREELEEVLGIMQTVGEVPDDWQLQGDTVEEQQMLLCEFLRPYARGISRRMLRELQLCSNLFIFPTVEESFGLVGPESSFSGCLNVNNRSLTMLSEVMGPMAPAFDFGSYHMIHKETKDQSYIRQVAIAIIQRLYMNESVMTKTFCRRRYNMNNIYRNHYLPMTLLY